MDHNDELLTTAQVAERLKVSTVTVTRWVNAGQLNAVRLPGGRALRYRTSDIDALVASEATS